MQLFFINIYHDLEGTVQTCDALGVTGRRLYCGMHHSRAITLGLAKVVEFWFAISSSIVITDFHLRFRWKDLFSIW